MKGDFSRNTFDPKKHYGQVLMQQGRVQVDADWNEQQAIHQHRIETEALDIIGQCGAPEDNPGFEITGGIDFKVGAGRFYVDGILCENETEVLYSEQPDLPKPDAIDKLLSDANTSFGIVYLDVWQQHLTALDDPAIREVALGGPDTATRLKTIWQVKVLAISSTPDKITCHRSFPEWDALITPSTGMLTAQATVPSATNNPCLLPPDAGYQRLENQLYRVEIHQGGNSNDPAQSITFKWSRDNGAVVTTIQAVSASEITVADLGPDQTRGFAIGQWVELSDDASELAGRPGQLVQITNISETGEAIISVSPAPQLFPDNSDGLDLDQNPKLRRWEHTGVVDTSGPIDLEGGIQVQFSDGIYKTGDYWLIPARTAIGQIEWPTTDEPNPTPIAQPPLGITHHYCRLALIDVVGDSDNIIKDDCRAIFPSLTQTAIHVTEINWPNDRLFSEFLRDDFDGLSIELDAAPVSGIITSANLIVTVDLPVTLFILDGIITVNSNVILWQPESEEIAYLRKLLDETEELNELRVRLTLKGHFIWSEFGKKKIYLDGQVFGTSGINKDGTLYTDLELPSGLASTKASDFESWFYVQLNQLVINKPEILQVESIKIITRTSSRDEVEGTELTFQELPQASAIFATIRLDTEVEDILEITFNFPITDLVTLGDNILILENHLVGYPPRIIEGRLEFRNGDQRILRYVLSEPKIFSEQTNKTLKIFGDDYGEGEEFALKDSDNITRLDGDFSGEEGGNFVLNFQVRRMS
ncbi:MAG: DUF6519 domain-containing protein [Cyanobacteria bacterium P01_F01_bin.150]